MANENQSQNNQNGPNSQNKVQSVQPPQSAPAPTPTFNLTQADLSAIVAAAVRAVLAPSPEDAAKKAAEEADNAIKREQMRIEADEWRQHRLIDQANCGHKKPRGEDSVVGKLYSDGWYRVMCIRCQAFIYEVQATPEMISQVMQADNLGASSWENFGRFSSGWIDNGQQNTAQ